MSPTSYSLFQSVHSHQEVFIPSRPTKLKSHKVSRSFLELLKENQFPQNKNTSNGPSSDEFPTIKTINENIDNHLFTFEYKYVDFINKNKLVDEEMNNPPKKKEKKGKKDTSHNDQSNNKRSKRNGNTKKRKKKKKKISLMNIFPVNEKSEKEKFLQLLTIGETYNPQFKYLTNPKRCKSLKLWDVPCTKYMAEAIRILERIRKTYGGINAMKKKTEGELLTSEQSLNYFMYYLKMHDLSNVCKIRLVESQASATCISKHNDLIELLIRLPLKYSMNSVQGVAHHELGTHLIRSVNDQKQPWYKNRKKFKLQNHLVTEEGLACLHTYLDAPCKLLGRAALHYYSACIAYYKPFDELFKDLEQYVEDREMRWNECLRVKRGIIDQTSGGCFAKDQAYLKGAIEILRSANSIDFTLLYSGKISLEEMENLKDTAKLDGLKLPYFIEGKFQKINPLIQLPLIQTNIHLVPWLDINEYRSKLKEIELVNGI